MRWTQAGWYTALAMLVLMAAGAIAGSYGGTAERLRIGAAFAVAGRGLICAVAAGIALGAAAIDRDRRGY